VRLEAARPRDHTVGGWPQGAEQQPRALKQVTARQPHEIEQCLEAHFPAVSGRAGDQELPDGRADEGEMCADPVRVGLDRSRGPAVMGQ
jgi:hypothetical protein